MKKSVKSIIKISICVILLIACILNFWYAHNIKEENSINIVGTYEVKCDDPMDNIYTVFTEDGDYMIYQQCDRIIEKGTYENENTAVFLMKNKKESIGAVSNDAVYLKVNGCIKKFKKTEDIPTYVNVTAP